MSLAVFAIVLAVSVIFASCNIVAFILGTHFGATEANKVKTEVKVIEIDKPFIVEKQTVREVTSPGFIYPKPGTPNPNQEAADKKMQELMSEPEL